MYWKVEKKTSKNRFKKNGTELKVVFRTFLSENIKRRKSSNSSCTGPTQVYKLMDGACYISV